EVQVEDSDIEDNLQEIQYTLAKTVAKEESEVVGTNDYIEFDMATFSDDGSPLNPEQPSKYYLGRIAANKDLEANFLGLKVGESKEFDYTFPEDFPTETSAGKTIKYKIKINGIFTVNLPELNDELAKEWNESESLEKLKNELKDNIKKQNESQLKEKNYDELLVQVIQNSSYILPESLVEGEVQNLFHQTIHQYGLGHMTMEKFAEMGKIELDELKKSYQDRALRNVKGYLTLYEIAKAEKIEIKQEEIKVKLDEYVQRVGQEQIKKMDANNVVRNIHDNILFDKIFELLLENADKKLEAGVSLNRVKSILSAENKE
ncbi:MAG: trigger factor, partial [Leptospiraceae bacterium]|nr:trigger factor [Leptospiraceae bacterium]